MPIRRRGQLISGRRPFNRMTHRRLLQMKKEEEEEEEEEEDGHHHITSRWVNGINIEGQLTNTPPSGQGWMVNDRHSCQ
ncbi:unnamed protein product [Onchocerca flexuosa]|uniref:Uncharacterized protein n=1 Tax=Onchocerca flexuosa TaxID=387005 RepID=A0A183HXR8_9BILA|nr:unnamed protein product [Onchocerca flexuosa]